jgi:hypothetical protein
MSEEWHKTHAVLLKSVAESQGKLLAGINALESKLDNLHGIAEHNAMEQSGKLDGIRDGFVDELRVARDSITECDARNTQQLERRLTKVMDGLGQRISGIENTLLGAIVHKRHASTKRKPRGRR